MTMDDEKFSPVSIRAWATAKVAEWSGLPLESVDPKQSLAEYGLDSLTAVSLVGELEEWLEIDLPDDLVQRCRTIDDLSAQVSALAAKRD